MGLRELAEQDLGLIVEDAATGFGWPITLTSPEGISGTFTGFSDDIAQVIDPDTGQVVSGRAASIAIRISSLLAKNFKLPQGPAKPNSRPWLVDFDDINGTAHRFKVANSNPDRTIGLVTCILEVYR